MITDAEERAALAACRGLESAGYRVSAVAAKRPAAAHWSRSCAARFDAPDPRDDVAAFAERLAELLAAADHAVLLPGSDASLYAISKHRRRLDPLARLGLPPHDVVRRALDKRTLLELAADVGLDSPESVACVDLGDAKAAAAHIGYPVVLKPVRSFRAVGDALRQKGVAFADGEAALASAVPELGTPFLVQRYESAGGLFSCNGVIADGDLLGLTASRVFRTWPVTGGMHTLAETVPIPKTLGGRVRALLHDLGWTGIFQLQMLELDDGRYAVIDLNPRVFASITLDITAGANLVAIWCDWLLGRQPASAVAKAGFRFRWEEGELCHFLWRLRRGELRAAASVLRPHRRVAHAWFRLRDPAPLAARTLGLSRRLAGQDGYRRSRGAGLPAGDRTRAPERSATTAS